METITPQKDQKLISEISELQQLCSISLCIDVRLHANIPPLQMLLVFFFIISSHHAALHHCLSSTHAVLNCLLMPTWRKPLQIPPYNVNKSSLFCPIVEVIYCSCVFFLNLQMLSLLVCSPLAATTMCD